MSSRLSVSSGIVKLENKTESIDVFIKDASDIKLWKEFTYKFSNSLTTKYLTIRCTNSHFQYDSHTTLFIIECLSKAITKNNTLTYLTIWGEELVMDSRCYKILANGIQYNNSITTLILWQFYSIGTDGIGYLTAVFQYNTNIKELKLNACKLGNDTTYHILNY